MSTNNYYSRTLSRLVKRETSLALENGWMEQGGGSPIVDAEQTIRTEHRSMVWGRCLFAVVLVAISCLVLTVVAVELKKIEISNVSTIFLICGLVTFACVSVLVFTQMQASSKIATDFLLESRQCSQDTQLFSIK